MFRSFVRRSALAALVLVLCLNGETQAQVHGYNVVGSLRGDYSLEYSMLQSESWRASLPNLSGYTVIGPTTGRDGPGAYNCFAHTIGVSDNWVFPGTSIHNYDRLYAASGYRRTAVMDPTVTPGQEKVAVYGIASGTQVEITHGAKQWPNGTWTSKLGSGPLIRHSSLDSLSGPAYGVPVAVYTRPAAGFAAQPQQFAAQPVQPAPQAFYQAAPQPVAQPIATSWQTGGYAQPVYYSPYRR